MHDRGVHASWGTAVGVRSSPAYSVHYLRTSVSLGKLHVASNSMDVRTQPDTYNTMHIGSGLLAPLSNSRIAHIRHEAAWVRHARVNCTCSVTTTKARTGSIVTGLPRRQYLQVTATYLELMLRGCGGLTVAASSICERHAQDARGTC